MESSDSLESPAMVRPEPAGWSLTVKLILAFILGLLALSPAILGIHWELILGK
jgi:hypothetical protein